MKLRYLTFILLLILLVAIYETNAGKGGRGSGGKNKYGGGGKSKWKKTGGKLAKAAVIGGGVYTAYQIGKMKGKFSSGSWGNDHGFDFDDWDDWREADGILCRNKTDCTWIDPNMFCQDYELTFVPNVSSLSI